MYVVKRFGAYEILHELKSGGMGSVLLGRRRGPGAFEQLVAIKTIRADHAGTEAVRAMFLDEAAILARIHHPAIATVHDFGEEGGTLYMVMEYVAGNSFRSLLGDERIPPGVAARAIAEACRGVHAAHEVRDTSGAPLGVVHRDLSPDNLMLGFDGHVKVIDFGIALIKNRQAPVTEFGTVKGKPPYMSPEQVKNEAMDRRSDVFSLGVVLHELLTGQPLFEGDSIYAIARAVEHQRIEPPSRVRVEPLPTGLDAAVMNALERDPERRTPSAAQLAEELERVISASGDETLEAWADRELASPREAHRAWLSNVIRGRDAPRPTIGRATGSVTQIAPAVIAAAMANAELAKAPTPFETARVATGEDELDRPPRRSLALPIIGGLVVLAVVVAIVATIKGREPAANHDAGVSIDAAAIVFDAAPLAVDAAMAIEIDAPPADAAVLDAPPIDAGRSKPRDAGRPPVDAGRTPPRDAAIAVALDAAVVTPEGVGIVTFRARKGTYATVVLDGKTIGPTPIQKKTLDAGRHTVEMIPPVGEDTYKLTFDLAPGETKIITQP